jgi:hypothetical protein
MERLFLVVVIILLIMGVSAQPGSADGVEAQAAFEQLKTLAGTWSGEMKGEGEEAETEAEQMPQPVHEFRVSAAGTVVMETMGPGTDHEMINMYHLDGEDLMLTHYCAGGNQPSMRLNRHSSTSAKLVFDFAGGTNLDPAVDDHIHAAEITLLDEKHLDSVWTSFSGGEAAHKMTFHLARTE